MRSTHCSTYTLATALVGVALCVAQPASAADGDRPSLQAIALVDAPVLDGDILGEEIWQQIPASTGFWQIKPFAGEPASEKTEIRIGFSEDTLYIGVVCFDREPERIVVTDNRRDASLAGTDSIQFIIDAFRDEQNGYVFGTNPAGIEYDGQVLDASGVTRGSGRSGRGGSSGRFRRGSNASGFNLNWDGAWQVETEIGDYGWSAEFAIPFTTLRYAKDEQIWGINFQRIIQRRQETAFWAKLEQQFNLYRLSDAGTLEGIEAPAQRNLKITPYVLGVGRRPGTGGDSIDYSDEWGIDLKYSLTPGLTLDLTYNTDFAQVEVDEQQVNLDRFNLFFPEKRPFFLENAGLFSVGSSGEAELFFSRRIGIGPGGTPIPILGGGRVSGKVGRTNIGILGMQTEDVDDLQANNFSVLRVSRELPNRSNLGAIFVGRSGTGSLAPPDDDNRTLGIDGQLGIGEYQNLKGWAAVTDTEGIDSDDHGYELSWTLGRPLWSSNIDYLEVGEGFNPEVGFLQREGFRKPSGRIARRVRPKDKWGIQELRPHASYEGYWDFDGFLESERIHIDNSTEWRNGTSLSTAINLSTEGVKEAFEISEGVIVPPGTYEESELFLFFSTDPGKRVSESAIVRIGGFFGGDQASIRNTLSLRQSERLTSEITWDHNSINLPWGDFDVNLGRLRLSYAPTPRLLVQLLTQYNDVSDQVSTNLRFSWLQEANTGLFIVYNEIDEFGMDAFLARADRSLTVKYSYLFDVFK